MLRTERTDSSRDRRQSLTLLASIVVHWVRGLSPTKSIPACKFLLAVMIL